VLAWLWVMVNGTVAFFSVKASRSKTAFEELIGHWAGILVSDGYGAYRKWVQMRQTCRLRGLPTYPILVEALTCSFQNQTPDVSWI
ncbi:MAG: transposase, partial [Syntrophobacteraceae bacterium]|nr:transposase [Syntrophobacteraceae bacterium]